jgi:hypothetical protein
MSNVETDNETYYESDDLYYDSDTSIDQYDIFYEPEEPSLTKYNIVICERYNPQYHGITESEVNCHYLTHFRFKKYDYHEISMMIRVISGRSTIEIAECFYLPSEECISILKTFWLQIIQRKWKNIIKERKNILKKRCHPNSIMYREIHGKWPNYCSYFPVLRGMLSNL